MNNLSRAVLVSLIASAASFCVVPLSAQQTLPSLRVAVSDFTQRLEPGTRGRVVVNVENTAATPATNVVLTVTLPAGGTIDVADPAGNAMTCSIANNVLVCTAPSLSNGQASAVDVILVAPPRRDGDDVVVRATVTSAEADLDPADNAVTRNVPLVRQFVVANVEDEGSGSLRQAILDVNALCPIAKPCAIVFEIPAPVPASGWFTIQPRTPLPDAEATLKIDGKTQTVFTGDTNPEGPEIEINGWLTREGSGLNLRPNCDVEVLNLAVNGFPGYGIAVRRMPAETADPCSARSLSINAVILDNYLGTDPRGRVAKSNQRGLGLFVMNSLVKGNLISGNRRSGIYAKDGFFTDIRQNRIGVAKDGSPLGNSAGIFLDMGDTRFGNPGGADVTENVIAYNDGMAIARSRRGEILITRNSMFDNLQQGIDVDVDGPTAQRTNDVDVPNAPVLFSAAFDPVRHATIVRGRIDSENLANSRNIEVYASTRLSVWATPQAEQWVGTMQLLSGHEDFEIEVPGDWRGKWITATHNSVRFIGFIRTPGGIRTQTHRESHPADTSELSNAVMAQ